MVKVIVKATDAQDNYKRDWLIKVDQVPVAPDWHKDGDTEVHGSGDTMSKDLTLTDGDHKVYFVVSQDGGPSFGSYSGSISFDDKSATFNGVNDVSPAGFKISVKGNAVVSESSSSSKMNFVDKLTAWAKQNKVLAVVIGVGVPVGLGVTAVVASKGNGNRRRL